MVFAGNAAYLEKVPVRIKQPDGTIIQVFVTGDEFHHRVHDAYDYTIIKNNEGYCVYAQKINGRLVPTNYYVGRENPFWLPLQPGLDEDEQYILEKRKMFFEKMQQKANEKGIKSLKSVSQINNIVIFIRFADEEEFQENIGFYDSLFNSDVTNANSMKAYYRQMSYNQLLIESYLFPMSSTTVLSYQDNNPRAYYQPYDEYTNPIGYVDFSDRELREHTLLANAVNSISSQIPSNINVDVNEDGNVDNVCFIVKGDVDAWAELLWPHRWMLYSQNAYINGKRVMDYNLQIESFFYDPNRGVGVLNHEMFHTLGAPDLYHYNTDYRNFRSVGYWDLMDRSLNPSESMLMYMKYLYAGWINQIPEITTPGVYYLHPSTKPYNNCYKVASTNPNEYFVLEYRKRDGIFENSIKSEGLLIYRINQISEGFGNSSYPDYPDEIYVYRPDGIDTINGWIDSATFSLNTNRTIFNYQTNPWDFLSDNQTSGGISISQVSAIDTVISFCFNCNLLSDYLDYSYEIKLFPNPVIYTLSISSIENYHQFRITNILGQEVMKGELIENNIDVSGLPSATYILELGNNKKFIQKYFIKQ